MTKPFVGISCCRRQFSVYSLPSHAASDTYVRAADLVVNAVPILIPANGEAADIPVLIERLDGIILTGSRSNVRPDLYGGPPHAEGTPEDEARDGVTLPLIRAALAAGLPLLAICRGLQELNVALGGSLHQRLQDLPGRFDHSTPLQPLARLRTAKAHAVQVVPGSFLHQLAETREIAVNSLHNQGIDRLAPGLTVEGTAPDGTIEAVRAHSAPGFAFGVQWHPEYDFETDALSRRIFAAFGDAVRRRRAGAQARFAAAAD
ncbi:MAG TPA: gamma-glutamyl-gamma-aminobutyrate hydrolase family protein [Acetobacteraceae bacterium]|jgi:putative glutamine amidotransferase|nr:gamma-glutamyl-gamma-aminobutyrate hydrolase family protein [Acetobacteraceae bacterium]